MKHQIKVEIPNTKPISLELDEEMAPNTVIKLLEKLPFSVGINLWGEEIYTDETQIDVGEENAKTVVNLNDVAYWPAGQAICLFYGPTPIGKKGEIKPYSPVNVIGKILNPDKTVLSKLGTKPTVTFSHS